MVDAVRDAANRWVFRDLDPEPWAGVRFAAVDASPEAGHAVDVTDTAHPAVASPEERRAYPAALSGTRPASGRSCAGWPNGPLPGSAAGPPPPSRCR